MVAYYRNVVKSLLISRLSIFFLLTACTVAAVQAAYPDKPIRIVVPFAPGGGTDLIARTFGQGMAQSLGQPVVIDNKPGAGTMIGTDLVAKSAADVTRSSSPRLLTL
jgi:tripartite-type tricarboxylate transporter receptor subunit TctC